MRDGLPSIFSLWKAIPVSMILWFYAGMLLYVWFFSRMTPEEAVLIRIGASIISDLVWIPLGIALWSSVFQWVALTLLKIFGMKRNFTVKQYSVIGALILVVFSMETAFRFLFIPLLISVAHIVLNIYRHRKPIVIFRFAPTCLILAATILNYGWQLFPSAEACEDDEVISVMTYNILGNASTQNRLNGIETIRHERPDVVCCTEYNPRSDPSVFTRELGDIYPYIVSNRDENSWRTGELIISRYPIIINKINDFAAENYIFAEINIQDKKINIVNVHLSRVGHQIEKNVEELPHPMSESVQMASDFEQIIDQNKYSNAQTLLKDIMQFQNPTIICGDLNDTPNSRVYRLFAGRYINAYHRKGWGLGATFGESWINYRLFYFPFLVAFARDIIRIDHIFVSRHFDVVSSRVVKNARGSDHKPVIAVVKLKGE